jgi:hypothetical protein
MEIGIIFLSLDSTLITWIGIDQSGFLVNQPNRSSCGSAKKEGRCPEFFIFEVNKNLAAS